MKNISYNLYKNMHQKKWREFFFFNFDLAQIVIIHKNI
jgi:hypothetical protein